MMYARYISRFCPRFCPLEQSYVSKNGELEIETLSSHIVVSVGGEHGMLVSSYK